MTARDDGGPAFPHEVHSNYRGGMTLRDWFAGQALKGLLSGGTNVYEDTVCAALAYHHADAMLKERSR